MSIRPAAVAGTWYPGTRGALTREVDAYLDGVSEQPSGHVRAIIAPHAGMMFSGPIAAHAYKLAATGTYDVAVIVGPSHFEAFQGVVAYPSGAFESPLGLSSIDVRGVEALIATSSIVRAGTTPHQREHSLEMQLPFLCRLLPGLTIVPLLMGSQRRETVMALAEALTTAFADRQPLLIASTDLSHYFDVETAAALDRRFENRVSAFDPEGLLAIAEEHPPNERGRYVGCGVGPAIAVMLAARNLGATQGRVLQYGHSGEISGDMSGVVGYLAAAFGTWPA